MGAPRQLGKRFKVALSFVGMRRPFVAQIANRLAEHLGRERVLYDAFYEAEFARVDLDTHLQSLYHDQSELIAVFLCCNYEGREWCGGVEWRAIKDLIKKRRGADIMLLRFDDTEIPGLFSTDGYVWIGERPATDIASVILERIGPAPGAVPDIDLTHLPEGAEHFLGRDAELAELDAAWAGGGKTAIVELIAPGGTGKTALVKRWLKNVQMEHWRGAHRVYGWSFYSQGTGEDRQASEDHFLAEALKWFGVKIEVSLGPWDKGRALAQAVAATRTLLVLDGVEPLQYPPGPLAGELRAPGLKALMTHLASAGHAGLCVLTSREKLKDLSEYTRDAGRADGAVLRRDLGNLDEADGAKLLHVQGANRAGAAALSADDEELRQASREVRGHALTLSLLGRYLALAYEGDIRRRDQIDFREADAEISGGHAFKVMAAYETWFARTGELGARELAVLRLLGFFDRPASEESLAALRAAPAIAGLTEALMDLSPSQWRAALKRLEDCGLIYPAEADGSLDAHPLVREYLADALKTRQPDAWKEGHRRLYEQLKTSAPHRPEGLSGLQPLYQAVAHGCQAGLWQETCDEVYWKRISRCEEAYVVTRLGAFGADLSAVACFFVEPWRRLASALEQRDQAWLLNAAAFRLRALGRLEEAVEPTQVGTGMVVEQEDWNNAAHGYNNLSELQLSLGRVTDAITSARLAVDYANSGGNDSLRQIVFTTLADALHQHGVAAKEHFVEAETLLGQIQPEYPQLYSLPGVRYCDLLLAPAERGAWRSAGDKGLFELCTAVARRAAQTLKWIEAELGPLDIALDHLTLARCSLYADRLQDFPPGKVAQAEIACAVAGLRTAGHQDYIPLGLLTRAWLLHALGDVTGAQADLNEAHQIASRGSMRLHLADIALTRARLFHDRAALAEARRLIVECGYNRRLPELEDAEAAAVSWPAALQ